MAGESLFRQLEIEAFRAGITPRTKQSIDWFKKKARQLFRGRQIRNRTDIMQDDALSQTTRVDTSFKGPVGNLYMFFYDAKHKKTLPYYDGFPLSIITGPAKGGFMGVNLHYLHPVARARLLDAVLGNGGGIPQKYLAPAQKHYLTAHVKSRFALVDKPEWEIAAFLPMADFKGADPRKVYKDTQEML
mgnify:FL=1|jgi:hypothetical protein